MQMRRLTRRLGLEADGELESDIKLVPDSKPFQCGSKKIGTSSSLVKCWAFDDGNTLRICCR